MIHTGDTDAAIKFAGALESEYHTCTGAWDAGKQLIFFFKRWIKIDAGAAFRKSIWWIFKTSVAAREEEHC
jgi:hypothetical protein